MKSYNEYVEFCRKSNEEFFEGRKTLLMYVRNEHRHRIGVVLAFRGDDNQIYIGYSLYNPIEPKPFNKHVGMFKARTKHLYRLDQFDIRDVRQHAHYYINEMLQRVRSYFKVDSGFHHKVSA